MSTTPRHKPHIHKRPIFGDRSVWAVAYPANWPALPQWPARMLPEGRYVMLKNLRESPRLVCDVSTFQVGRAE